MVMDGADLTTSSHGDYRAAARKLRWRYRDDRPALQRGLGRLARDRDGESSDGAGATVRRAGTALGAGFDAGFGNGVVSPAGLRFAALAAGYIDAPVLPYDQRKRLMAAAAGMGVERFEANLVLALLQHRRGQAEADARPAHRTFSAKIVALFLAMETLIALTAWWWWM